MYRCRQDLHLHIGGDSLENLLKNVKKSGIKTLSIIDKESVDRITEIEGACKKHDLNCLRGVEVNARYANNIYHFLVYNFKNIQKVRGFFKKEAKAKYRRAMKVVARLQKLGWRVNFDSLNNIPRQFLGRRLVVENVRNHPENQERLLKEEIFGNDDFYRRYLEPGKPAYCARKVSSVYQLLKTMRAAGALIIWAHPWRSIHENFGQSNFKENFLATFNAFLKVGVDGVEVYYPDVPKETIIFMYRLCRKNHMLVSIGSDSVGSDLTPLPAIIKGMEPDSIISATSLYRGVL
mgnify:CR=1 FL=1